MVRGRRGRKPRGRRRARVPAIPSLNCTTATTGTTTTFSRSSFGLLAGCGDRQFKLVGISLQIASYSEPFLLQVHIFSPEGKEVGLGQQFITENRRRINLRIPPRFKAWFDGNSAQTTTLVTVLLLPVYQGQKNKVTFILNALFRFGAPLLVGK